MCVLQMEVDRVITLVVLVVLIGVRRVLTQVVVQCRVLVPELVVE